MRCYVDIIGISEGEKRRNGPKDIFEALMARHFPKLMTYSKPKSGKLRECQAGYVSINKYICRHFIFKQQKIMKKKMLKKVK